MKNMVNTCYLRKRDNRGKRDGSGCGGRGIIVGRETKLDAGVEG
jgi:hypothetical protein